MGEVKLFHLFKIKRTYSMRRPLLFFL